MRPVMCDPVAAVLGVGSVETCNDRIDALRSVHGERCRVEAAHPALQHEGAKPIDMIGMKMSQQDRLDTAGRERHALKVSCSSVAGIDHEQAAARDDRNAWPGPKGVGKGRACAA